MAKKKKVTTTTVTTVVEEIVSSNEKTQIICILDRSGSMADKGIIVEAINGFNNFLDEQKKLKDKATITVALFDDQYQLLYDDVDIQKVEKITKDTWTPRGMTALYDAIGKTINTVKANRVKLGSEKADKVLVCIVTDGLENASHEYTRDAIKNLIQDCEKEDWNFIYLAANQDAFAVGSTFGVSFGNTYTFTADAVGAQNMSMTLNNASVSYRSMSRSDVDYAKKSKNLIGDSDDKNEPEDNGNITITNSNTNTVTQ
jgi:uncharacterized protein YegL